jgi:hypothetical protein
MIYPTKIEGIVAANDSCQEIISVDHCFIELHQDHIKYKHKFLVSEKNPQTELFEEKKCITEVVFKRAILAGYEEYRNVEGRCWSIIVITIGGSQFTISFKKKEEANVLKEKMHNYIFEL